ncbi:MAG: hypothetical protein AUJ92_11155 [Armatimonadetes bacterium CG2_30_59_28]|nr:DUF1844 domain-containing protein [Armatimonadota bacterium]OIO94011.1 MAG: hypothetical protein AUJ92_11155 [Armatimonadetes bacterium CG2_30_59_28]PIU62405.1 MAG: hypothetical protein COS85_18580 [Armatimonadetes bacterium CG07_land_8_20_14_0_80_59_28]PIX44404.1 MAG: hypothetical protein COZ56_04605 [Armatimonadetes bacterium CG_4_8_14_3_um_filter_58_9]PIY48953.1 MAG: hypothetical protein COZ05_01760 [Armatimonadetes bacterium CG_4_10_14_3_um_filter_59_10]
MSDEEKQPEEKEEIIVHDRRLLTEEERQGNTLVEEDGPHEQVEEPTDLEPDGEGDRHAEEEAGDPPQDVDVPTLVQFLIGELSARAWINLGLIQNPMTKLVVKDISQARLAIDCMAALVEKISPHLEDEEKRQYDRLLNDLRMNFLQQSGG